MILTIWLIDSRSIWSVKISWNIFSTSSLLTRNSRRRQAKMKSESEMTTISWTISSTTRCCNSKLLSWLLSNHRRNNDQIQLAWIDSDCHSQTTISTIRNWIIYSHKSSRNFSIEHRLFIVCLFIIVETSVSKISSHSLIHRRQSDSNQLYSLNQSKNICEIDRVDHTITISCII